MPLTQEITPTHPQPPELAEAYAYCREAARRHYENFPVASLLLPSRMRAPVSVIYTFARQADDLADEGPFPADERLRRLEAFEQQLTATIDRRTPHEPVFVALADVLERYELPAELFHDLLSAFRQDVTQTRYADFGELLNYCRRSANPVGRLLLHLHGSATEENLALSDHICTALQLINFWQDLAQDYDENNRIYVPVDEMARFEVTESHFRERRTDSQMLNLMELQWQRARRLMLKGVPLPRRVKGRFGFELRLIVEGGLRIIDRLEACRRDIFARPRLRRQDALVMVWRAIFLRRFGKPYNVPNSKDAGCDDA